jgi:mRNA interferase HigB
MRIISFRRIKEFSEEYYDAKVALQDWYFKTSKAEWQNAADIKRTFSHVDFVGNHRVIFNIKGNKYWLVAIAIFPSQKGYIRFIGIHNEYDKIDSTTI